MITGLPAFIGGLVGQMFVGSLLDSEVAKVIHGLICFAVRVKGGFIFMMNQFLLFPHAATWFRLFRSSPIHLNLVSLYLSCWFQ